MAKVYEVLRQTPQIIMENQQPTQGFVVRANLIEFDEIVEVYVSRLDPERIDRALRELLEARRQIAALGDSGDIQQE